jgi:predicted transcriptional regulator
LKLSKNVYQEFKIKVLLKEFYILRKKEIEAKKRLLENPHRLRQLQEQVNY